MYSEQNPSKQEQNNIVGFRVVIVNSHVESTSIIIIINVIFYHYYYYIVVIIVIDTLYIVIE